MINFKGDYRRRGGAIAALIAFRFEIPCVAAFVGLLLTNDS